MFGITMGITKTKISNDSSRLKTTLFLCQNVGIRLHSIICCTGLTGGAHPMFTEEQY
jgi:hypothetical protein